jgi:hypothetical protein
MTTDYALRILCLFTAFWLTEKDIRPNGTTIHVRETGMDREGNCRGMFERTIWEFTWRDYKKYEKTQNFGHTDKVSNLWYKSRKLCRLIKLSRLPGIGEVKSHKPDLVTTALPHRIQT